MSRGWLLAVAVVSAGCGRGQGVVPDGGGPMIVSDGGLRGDAGAQVTLRPCPTRGAGAMEGDVCFVITPAETGLPASGAGATVDQYALRPSANARGQLLLFFNGSGGSPRAGTGTSAGSWYGVARAQGLHVLAPSYVSGSTVGGLCGGLDACFEPTRATILTGDFVTGAADSLSDMTFDEAAFDRIAAALLTLSDSDRDGRWGDFLDRTKLPDAEAAIRWDKVIVSGHSQGGGHAALIGKRQSVARVVMLASPCDSAGGTVATWLSSPSGYKTDPSTTFFGLASMGDTTCPRAHDAWQALGMPSTAQTRDAPVCAGEAPHGAPLGCSSNAAAWAELLKP
ncbi:MAG: hypothetical protein Q8N26_01485 [Myxococcales bacterium]|nr:hypothetical protein [Myxococcales bacterium]